MDGNIAENGEKAGIHPGNNDLGSFYGAHGVCISAFIYVYVDYLCFLACLYGLHQHYMLPSPLPLLKYQKKKKKKSTLKQAHTGLKGLKGNYI